MFEINPDKKKKSHEQENTPGDTQRSPQIEDTSTHTPKSKIDNEKKLAAPATETNNKEKESIKEIEEAVQTDNETHATERRVGHMKRMLRTALLATALSATGGYAEQQQYTMMHKTPTSQIDDVETQKYFQERKNRSISALSEYFNNPEEIVQQCGGVVDVGVPKREEHMPTIMHIAQTHKSDNNEPHTPESAISQDMASRCITSMIEGNNTDKPLTIGFEFVANNTNKNRDRRLRTYSASRFQYEHTEFLTKWRNPDNSFRPGQPQLNYSELESKFKNDFLYFPEEINKELDAILHIAHYFKPKETERVLSMWNRPPQSTAPTQRLGSNIMPNHSAILNFNEITAEAASRKQNAGTRLLKIMYDIEKEYNVYFAVHDGRPPNKNIEKKMVRERKKGLKNIPMTGETLDIITQYNDEVCNNREKIAFDMTLDHAAENSGFGVLLYGSGHDFSNEAHARAQLLRAETSPGMLTKGYADADQLIHGYYWDGTIVNEGKMNPYKIANENLSIEEIIDHMKQNEEYEFLLHNMPYLKSHIDSETLFSLIKNSVRSGNFYWMFHEQKTNEMLLRKYLLPEDFNWLISEVNSMMEGTSFQMNYTPDTPKTGSKKELAQN